MRVFVLTLGRCLFVVPSIDPGDAPTQDPCVNDSSIFKKNKTVVEPMPIILPSKEKIPHKSSHFLIENYQKRICHVIMAQLHGSWKIDRCIRSSRAIEVSQVSP